MHIDHQEINDAVHQIKSFSVSKKGYQFSTRKGNMKRVWSEIFVLKNHTMPEDTIGKHVPN